jgi:hypothetical protein
MDERMRPPRPTLKAVVLAILALAVATGGLALASTGRDGNEPAAGKHLALGKGHGAALSRRVHGVIAHARATARARRPGGPQAGPIAPLPAPVGAAPAPAAAPPTSAPVAAPEVAAKPPAATATPTPPVPAPTPPDDTPEPVVPEPPPATPAPPEPEPAPAPAPEVNPPSPPPKKSTGGVSPGVPVEPAPAPDTTSLTLGIDGGYAGWSAAEIEERAALGAAVTRHEWDIANPVESEEQQVLAAATEIHTRILALLGGNDLGDPAHYADWVIGFIRYYGPGGRFWSEHPNLDASRYAIDTIELGNEPYFGEMSAQEYADTVRPTLERIEALDLPVKVLLPSRVYGTDTSWMDTLYQRIPNLNGLFYAFADHPYWYGHDPAAGGAAGPLERIATLRQRMNELGADSKPIFITEYGESTANCGSECVSEAVQAEHLQAMIAALVSHPAWKVELLSLFQLIDRGTDSTDRELQFGLLRQDGTPKPAYAIVHAAMQQYR